MADLRKELASLRKQASLASTRPAALEKEKEMLRKDVEKRKAKMQDLEAKLKSTLQDKVALQVSPGLQQPCAGLLLLLPCWDASQRVYARVLPCMLKSLLAH